MKHRTPQERKAIRIEILTWVKVVIELALLAACVWAAVWFIQELGITSGHAEEWKPNPWDAAESYTEAYVICQPGDYVNAREHPRKNALIVARFYPGDSFLTTGEVRNGFVRIIQMSAEVGEGWISGRYVVYDRPEEVNVRAAVVSKGKLAARKNIGGDVRKRLKNGDAVTVYWRSDEWCVTNRGFIMTKYLRLEGEDE